MDSPPNFTILSEKVSPLLRDVRFKPRKLVRFGVRMIPFRRGMDVARKAFSKVRIVYDLRRAEGGSPVVGVGRRTGVSE